MYIEGKPFLVFAGNYQEFTKYCIEKSESLMQQGLRVRIRDFIYVKDINNCLVYRDVHGAFVGTWKQRPDIKLIIQQMMYINIKEELPKEVMDFYKDSLC